MRTKVDTLFQNLYYSSICLANKHDIDFDTIRVTLMKDVVEDVKQIVFNHDVRCQLFASGIYLLQSDGKYVSNIVPLFMKVFKYLLDFEWISYIGYKNKVSEEESFVYYFNMLLNDIAVCFPNTRDTIITAQRELLDSCAFAISKLGRNVTMIDSENGVSYLLQFSEFERSIYVLTGLLRSCGRYGCGTFKKTISPDASVFPPLMNINDLGSSCSSVMKKTPKKFDSLMGQSDDSLSVEELSAKDENSIGLGGNCFCHGDRSSTFSKRKGGCVCARTLESRRSFTSERSGPRTKSDSYKILGPVDFDALLENVLCIVRPPVSKTVEEYVNACLPEEKFRNFARHYSVERITYESLTMLREVAYSQGQKNGQKATPEQFEKKMFNYAMELLSDELEKLKDLKFIEEDKKQRDHCDLCHKVKLTVMICSICLELSLCSATKEVDAENLLNKISECLSTQQFYHFIFMPYSFVNTALDTLGKLGEKFPAMVMQDILPVLTKFLLEPSPILNKCATENNPPESYNSKLSENSKRRRALKSLRKATIRSVCKALRSALRVGKDAVEACFYTVSTKLLYTGEDVCPPITKLVMENVILILGGVGVEMVDVDDVPRMVFNIFHERLFKKSTAFLDEVIVNALADMWIAGAKSIYDSIWLLFTKITIESSNRAYSVTELNNKENRYSHVSLQVDKALNHMAEEIQDEDDKMLFLTKLLEIFVQLGIEGRKISERTNAVFKTSTCAGNLGILIPKIAALIRRMDVLESAQIKLRSMFRDFWLNCTVLGFDVPDSGFWTSEWYKGVCDVACKSPVLIPQESLRAELAQNPAVKNDAVTVTELQEIRNTVIAEIQPSTEIANVINKMEFAHCIYLLSVFRMETMRALYSSEPRAVHSIFRYLEERSIRKDKSGMWSCLLSATTAVFSKYVNYLKDEFTLDENLEQRLELHAQFLLVIFNHGIKEMRRCSDTCLTKLVDSFPHLVWNGKVLGTALKLLELLSCNLENDVECSIAKLPLPWHNWTIQLQDTYEQRKSTVKDFTQRCEQILREAMKWAPESTRSHLIEYVANSHPATGASFRITIEAFLNNVGDLNGENGASPDASLSLLSLYYRSLFTGEVYGMLDTCKLIDPVNFEQKVISQLEEGLEAVLGSDKEKEKSHAVMKLAALFITLPELSTRLLHILTTIPLRDFSPLMMRICVMCWNWILVARPNVQLPFLNEMANTWTALVYRGVGLFERDHTTDSPLSTSETSSKPPITEPHSIWIDFLRERMIVAKYSRREQMDVLEMMFARTLSLAIGDKVVGQQINPPHGLLELDSFCGKAAMSRSVEAVGVRFRLLNCVLSMIQGDSLSTRISKNIIRQRVYAAALDYFTVPPQTPTQSATQLKNDISQLNAFRTTLYTDARYIKKEMFASVDAELTLAQQALPGNLKLEGSNVSKRAEEQTLHAATSSTYITMLASQRKASSMVRAANNDGLRRAKNDVERQVKIYNKRRNLILTFVANEISRLSVWLNPTGETIDKAEAQVDEWRKSNFTDPRAETKIMKEYVKLAWELSPDLTIHMPARFRTFTECRNAVHELIVNSPEQVAHIPEALPILLADGKIMEEKTEDLKCLSHVLTWARCTPVMAISLLGARCYPTHPITVQYAVRVLKSYPPDILLQYIPQMVQAIRHDTMGYVAELLVWLAGHSQLLAHQLLWNMQTNLYRDEDSKIEDAELFEPLKDVINKIISQLEGAARRFYDAEFDLFKRITDISGIIKPYPKGDARKKACLDALSKIKITSITYLPSNPEAVVLDIDHKSGNPMQSAAKAPFLARFKVCDCGVKELEEIGLRAHSKSPSVSDQFRGSVNRSEDPRVCWRAAIFKVGDDVRQDMLALQLMRIMKNVFTAVHLDVKLFPYRVVATSPGCGIIECVPNAKSRDQLGRQTDFGLYEYYIATYGDENSETMRRARRNFIRSMAAYSVFSFLLQIKDRHNGNIMIDGEGHIVHIDFGFMFESSPGGNLGFEPDFKLSSEMVAIMGGKMEAAPFRKFASLCVQAYLALRPYQESFIALVSLMLDTRLPCFRGKTIQQFRDRFAPNASDRDAAKYMVQIIRNCFLNIRSKMYDHIQYFQNDIPY